MSTPPTGDQHVLVHGEHTAVVTEIGAGLRAYDVSGVPVVDGFAEAERAVGARGQVLLPWPNRVGDGAWQWRGERLQLALSEPDRSCAIHGLTRWAPWSLVDRTAAQVRLGLLLAPQSGWPFVLRCQVDYGLDDAGLQATTTVTNVGNGSSPVAFGAHPYLSAGGGLVDDCEVRLQAAAVLLTDDRGLPAGVAVVSGDFDLRRPSRIGSRRLDHAFTDLEADADGRSRLVLSRPDGSAVQVWSGPGLPWLQVFSGDTLPESVRRRGLAVEPTSAPPDALRSGVDLVVLAPGEARSWTWGAGPA